ncbi:MAG TPA: ParB/RepB/Spo0J family partition protein [Kiritimatiellia bacterium]|nr:ParB/RepB/Spo0J family partition protein [Kiritimatiellia bacterium]HOR74903.1 ParB/RepB/Spo0J family partition protein [Kiritimatiellia bacterium]HOU58373.1 ParB/RepB/Spo0J family partition protein [Kiritimatiellia bacterium]HPK68626.1 ParB/RepB/Spo0J family partition protein [Kiritimatiellia bacterium]HPV45959.1 ParB/RepB/Spo0J family partition protein [Kiritimatiellia bacterium]
MATQPKHRGLGRGLDALIKGSGPRAAETGKPPARPAAPPATAAVPPAKDQVRRVAVQKIKPGAWQPRRVFAADALQELADSIREKGVLEPVWLRQVGDMFELIAGERRFRAAQLAGLAEIPALLHEVSDVEAREMALIENLQRADLDLIEEAEGYRDLMQAAALTQEEVARRVGKARATVANALRLLDLSSAIKSALSAGTLSAGHAKVLLGVAAPDRDLLAARVIAQGLSVRALEKLVAGLDRTAPAKKKTDPAKTKPASDQSARQLKFLADRMQQELGTKVTLTPARVLPDGKRAMGQIVIEYFDNEDLSRLLDMLNLGDLA